MNSLRERGGGREVPVESKVENCLVLVWFWFGFLVCILI